MENIESINMIEKRKRGRPRLPPHKLRVRCSNLRMQRWVLYWLSTQRGIGGKLVEQAVIKMYHLSEEQIKDAFYTAERGENDD